MGGALDDVDGSAPRTLLPAPVKVIKPALSAAAMNRAREIFNFVRPPD
jgi:hypothetical protein